MTTVGIVTHASNTFKKKEKNFTLHAVCNSDIICIMKNNDLCYNKNSARELLDANGFKFSKSMGQNFLIDANIPEKIVTQSGINESCGILEVGPGLGALTFALGRAAGKVTAIELDKRLVPILKNLFAENPNITIIQGDILRMDIKKLVDKNMSGLDYHVSANLPYNITTPAITAFIESGAFKSITVMVQKEVALRICARPGTSEYGSFTVYSNYHSIPKILFDVPPECFTPRPKITSSVVKMEIREERILTKEDEKTFFKVVRAAFGQRRKTLVNALHSVFDEDYSKAKITEIVENCGFDTRIRGEVLGIDEFIKLSSFLNT